MPSLLVNGPVVISPEWSLIAGIAIRCRNRLFGHDRCEVNLKKSVFWHARCLFYLISSHMCLEEKFPVSFYFSDFLWFPFSFVLASFQWWTYVVFSSCSVSFLTIRRNHSSLKINFIVFLDRSWQLKQNNLSYTTFLICFLCQYYLPRSLKVGFYRTEDMEKDVEDIFKSLPRLRNCKENWAELGSKWLCAPYKTSEFAVNMQHTHTKLCKKMCSLLLIWAVARICLQSFGIHLL